MSRGFNGGFAPFRRGDFMPRSRIREGDAASGTQETGTMDLASNNNYLRANCKLPLMTNLREQSANSSTYEDVHKYLVYVPGTYRDTYRYKFLLSKPIGGTFSYTILVDGITVYTSGALTALTPTWYINDLTLSTGTYSTIRLRVKYVTTVGLVYRHSAMGFMTETPSPLAAETGSIYTDFSPADTVQGASQAPLSVHNIRKLLRNNTVMAQEQHMNTIVSLSYAATKLEADTPDYQVSQYWMYWPRDGVSQIEVRLEGRTVGWLSGEPGAGARIGFENGPYKIWGFASSSYVAQTKRIDVPEDRGPLIMFIELHEDQTTTKIGQIRSLTAREIY